MVKLLIFLSCISLFVCGLDAVLYDCYTGKPATEAQLRNYEKKNNTGDCTVDIEPCDPEEWKRLDGSCTNLQYPSRGTHRTPTTRLLTPEFSPNYEPRKALNGESLPLPRRLRTEILQMGSVSDMRVTMLASYYVLFSVGDINSIHDILNYVMNITNCCTPEGKKDYRCTPNEIPVDDPVHRFSGISCMNLTRPQSFQSYGCRENGTTFTRMTFQTPVFDLSNIYNLLPGFIDRLRTYKNGLLKVEEENGFQFPPSDPKSTLCVMNQPPRETRCNMYLANIAIGSTLLNLIFYRQHNQIAEGLYKLNPTWDDERLFFTARDINIAISLQIFLYELLPIFLGRRNLIKDGILCSGPGFRDTYDENISPLMTDEYAYAQRWFHTIQETNLKLYDKDGYFLRTIPLVNCTARTGFLAIDDNMLEVIQGSFRQVGGKSDFVIDYDMADRALGTAQLSTDVATSDVNKGRLFGMPPYIKYREFCMKKPYRNSCYLQDCFSSERVYRMQQIYKTPKDIDLITGLWAEKHVNGGRVPQTLYCLMVEQLTRTIASDRHWYERPNRPHAFTPEQLQAIRKVTIAGVLCSAGNFVEEIQPRAFLSISSRNPLTNCSSPEIGNLDLTPWKECVE